MRLSRAPAPDERQAAGVAGAGSGSGHGITAGGADRCTRCGRACFNRADAFQYGRVGIVQRDMQRVRREVGKVVRG